MPFSCEECKILGARIIFGHDIRLCKDCKKLFKYRLINKTKIIKQYGIKIEELEHLEYKEVGNPLFRNASNMILYKEKDIIHVFINKYYKYIDYQDKLKLEFPEANPNYIDIITNILILTKKIKKK